MVSQRHYEPVAQAHLRGVERAAEPYRIASMASRGKLAIANAKLAYQGFRELFRGNAFRHLQERGLYPRRLLWASTGTKNPEYRDILYVEELIGPETVNTIPPRMLEAFRQHGNVTRATVLEAVNEADAQLRRLAGNRFR